jgi:hypothetical protein
MTTPATHSTSSHTAAAQNSSVGPHLREALLLRREDAALAMREAKRLPWLCSGLDGALLPIMLEPPPAWIPKQGERLASQGGHLIVLRRELVEPRTSWPWLLCAMESPQGSLMNERPSAYGALGHFSRRAFIYCALLCWRSGRSRSTVDEHGAALRLLTAHDLARAAMAMTPTLGSGLGSGTKLGSFRAARSHAKSPSQCNESLGAAVTSARAETA